MRPANYFMKVKSILPSLVMASFCQAGEPRIIAHRGASHDAPENTMAAFGLAWQQGADGIEGDFWLSKDGQIVCMHDADSERTTGVKKVISETEWDDLKSLDAGSWKDAKFKGERIPLLAEVMDSLPPGKRFFIEIKCGPEIVPALKKLLEEKNADRTRITLISFNQKVIARCRDEIPDFEAHLISSLKEIGQAGNEQKITDQLERCDARGLQFQYQAEVTRKWLANLKKRGLKLTAWVVNDGSALGIVSGYDLDFITTDRPAHIRERLAARAATSE